MTQTQPAGTPQFTDQGLSGLGAVGPNGEQQQFTMSWDQFNGLAPQQQQSILAGMGLSQDQITQLQHDLQQTEVTQYQQYQQQQAHDNRYGPVGNFVRKVPVLGWLSDQGEQTAADLTGGALGGKSSERLDPMSVSQIQQKTGFAGLIQQLQNQQSSNAALGKLSPNQQAQNPNGVTGQQLQQYLKSYVDPLIQQQQNAVAGDMSFWKDAIGKIGGGYPGMADTMKEEIPMMQNLYQQLVRDNVTAQTLSPYLQQVNNQIASATTTGEAARALGSTYQSISQAAQSDPALQQLLNNGGLGSLTGGSGISALTGGGVAGAVNAIQNAGAASNSSIKGA